MTKHALVTLAKKQFKPCLRERPSHLTALLCKTVLESQKSSSGVRSQWFTRVSQYIPRPPVVRNK